MIVRLHADFKVMRKKQIVPMLMTGWKTPNLEELQLNVDGAIL